MGTGLVLKCKNCNYKLTVNLGMGFGYPRLCDDVLNKIKDGTMGEEFQTIVNSIENPAVYASRELYLCESCENLKPELSIILCSPIKKSDQKFSGMYEDFKLHTYLMGFEINYTYKAELANEHYCEKCKTKMKKLTTYGRLKCPECHKALTRSTYLWD